MGIEMMVRGGRERQGEKVFYLVKKEFLPSQVKKWGNKHLVFSWHSDYD